MSHFVCDCHRGQSTWPALKRAPSGAKEFYFVELVCFCTSGRAQGLDLPKDEAIGSATQTFVMADILTRHSGKCTGVFQKHE